jgi:hypothetical protein
MSYIVESTILGGAAAACLSLAWFGLRIGIQGILRREFDLPHTGKSSEPPNHYSGNQAFIGGWLFLIGGLIAGVMGLMAAWKLISLSP